MPRGQPLRLKTSWLSKQETTPDSAREAPEEIGSCVERDHDHLHFCPSAVRIGAGLAKGREQRRPNPMASIGCPAREIRPARYLR